MRNVSMCKIVLGELFLYIWCIMVRDSMSKGRFVGFWMQWGCPGIACPTSFCKTIGRSYSYRGRKHYSSSIYCPLQACSLRSEFGNNEASRVWEKWRFSPGPKSLLYWHSQQGWGCGGVEAQLNPTSVSNMWFVLQVIIRCDLCFSSF